MKKVFNIEVDCAACALKCEEAIKKVEGVDAFITQKMTIEADDVDAILKKALKTAKKVEPDFEIVE